MSRFSLFLLIALLLGATTINYIDRQVLSVLAPVLRNEFNMSNEQYAGILNAFMVTYAIGMPLAGWTLDRIGVGRGLTLAVAWWSVAGMLTSLARGPISLGIGRSLLAVGESGAWPSFAKAVAIWVPAQWRTLAIGVCNSGSSRGAMIAPPLVVWLTHRHGWQGAFIITGALGFVWVRAFQLFRRFHPQMRESDREQNAPDAHPVRWRTLLRRRQMWIVFVCRFLADPIWYFYIFWIPEFLTRERGLSLAAIGAVAWIPFLFSDVSNFVTGILAQRLERAGCSVNRTRKCLMLIGAVVSPIGVAAVYAQSLFLTMTFICIAIFFWMIWSVTVQTLRGDYFPPQAVASVYGFGGMGSTLGSVISIWLVGRTLDITHSYVPVFVGLGLLMPVACVVGLALMGRVERVELQPPIQLEAATGASL
jgi:ACS family hexuronate transporter-like MFS transporter